MKSLITGLVAMFVLFTSGLARAQDPTAPGPFTVLTAQYNRGNTAFSCPASSGCTVPNSEILGEVYYPSNLAAGPFPLIIFLHGRHSTCYDPSNGSLGFWNGGCTAPFVPIPSFRGYDYIGRILASHGYIVASISANGINAQDFGAGEGITDRGFLVEAHLKIWNDFNTVGSTVDGPPFTNSFIGKVDLNHVGTMGHSRGGDGVVKHFSLFGATSPFKVRAVLPIAPTNFLGTVINNVNLGVLLSYCDGDVFTLEGSLFYDRARYAVSPDESFKYTFLAQGGNHNFFNSVWTPDCWTNPGSCWTDSRGAIPTPATVDDFTAGFSPFPSSDPFCGPAVPGNGRLTSAQQRAVGLAYVAAFFRFHIGGETDFGPLLRGDMPPPATVDPRVFIGFQPPSSRRGDLNRLNDASELLLTTLTGTGGVQGAVTESNLLTFQRCGFDLADPCFTVGAREVHLSNFSGLNPGLSRVRTAWNVPANFVNQVPPGVRDLRRFDDLQFRVGVDFTDRNNPIPNPQEVTIALSDGISTSTVSTNSQLGINDLFFPPGNASVTASTVMNTLRLPLSAFSGVNLGDVRSVAVQYNRTPAGTILLSDMSFVADQQARALCEASLGFVVGDRGQVSTPGGGFAVLNAGTGQTQIGRDARTDGILSVGPVQILERALVSGDVVSAGTITLLPTATVTGTQTPGGVVSLPPLPALPVFPPPSGGDIFVNQGPTRNLAPGSYPSVTVNSGGSLRLTSGTYFFVNLTVNSSSRVEVAADTRVLVKTALAYRSSFVNASSAVQSIFLGFAGTDATFEAVFNGTLVAPNAHVAFGVAAGLPYTGTFLARSLEVRPGSSLLCTAGPTGPSGSATPTCTDGIKNGLETGVDCGGPVCLQCPAGQGCNTGSDCLTGICTGGICQPPPGSVTATRTISADWGFGYCATLFVRNNTSLPTIRWTVSVDTNQSTIYTSWNGTFSGSSGVVSVAPAFDWNRVIQPGATDGSVGFCANRNVPGSGVLPVVQGASGTF